MNKEGTTVTNIIPCGVTFEFIMDGERYYVHLYVNFDKEKVYGNDSIDVEQLIIFNEYWNRIEWNDDMYPLLEKYIVDVVINES